MKKLSSTLIFVLFASLISGAASASTELVFTGVPTVSGSGVGDTARWTNVGSINGTTINVELKIITLDAGGSVGFITTGDDARVLYSPGFAGAQTTIDYQFFEAGFGDGFTRPITIIPEAGFKDIDDTSNETAIFQTSEVASYILENPTDLNVVDNAGSITVTSNQDGSSESNINIQIQFQPTTVIRVVYQADGGTRWFDFDGDVDLVFFNPDLTQLDTTPPAVPTVVSQTTNDTTPTLTGTAEAFSTVSVVVGGATFEVIADIAGNWILDTSSTPVSGTFSPNVNGANEVVVTSTDAAGNSTNDATSNELTIDTSVPSIAIQNAPTAVNSTNSYSVTFEFSEDVTGFEIGDITVNNATASNFVAVDGNTYTADITPSGAGDISIDVAAGVAQDAATNVNTAATTVSTVFDNTLPTVAIQNAPATANSTTPFTITVEFSEDVTGFELGDIAVGNATASDLVAVDGNTYTALITPSGAGNITINVAADVAVDAAGNGNTAATQTVTIFDNIIPTVTIQGAPTSANSTTPYPVTIEFSEDVTNFVLGDITVGNGVASNFVAVDGNTYTVDITPDGNGNVTIDVAAGVAQDVAGNSNSAATQVVTVFDADAPTVTIQNVPATVASTSPYTVTIEFSEDVTGFVLGDITVGNGTASNFVAVDANTYTVDITPDGNGDITIDVAAAVAQDAVGNDNLAATQVSSTLATDGDSDGIPDGVECPSGPPFDATCQDSDGDGTPDHLDLDSDNDGIPDTIEAGNTPAVPVDTDNDGTADFLDPDSDNDGIPDSVEAGSNPATPVDSDTDGTPDYLDLDSDDDGIPDVTEDDVASGTDTDSDGIDDGYDVNQTNGSDADNDGVDDAVTATDTDNDGHPDYRDLDSDSDGISDQLESGYDASGVDFTQDADGDGMPDAMDSTTTAGTDTDSNGVLDSLEPVNTDSDAQDIADYRDLDSDNDGILDVTEAGLTDADNDGLVDGNDADGDGIVDTGAATAPVLDTDSDGLPDYTDLESSNPANDGAGPFDIVNNPQAVRDDANGDGIVDDTEDNDADGIMDSVDNAEGSFGSLPPLPDADNDGIPDAEEGTGDTDGDGIPDSEDPDSDNDGVPDAEEAGLDPANPSDSDNDGNPDYLDNDSDNDGIPDAIEAGPNPLSPVDSDGDGIPDLLDRDSDNDTIPDAVENTGASGNDSDNDGIDDSYDADSTSGTDANNDGIDDNIDAADADGDSIANYLDLDSDNDSILDIVEDDIAEGADTDLDGIDDGYQISGNDLNNDGVDDDVDATDTDNDGLSDYLDLDSDSDGIPDQIEAGYVAGGVDFTQDADADGIPDGMDADLIAAADVDNNGIVDSLEPVNTDGDLPAIPDFRDLDSDNDSLLDTAEAGLTDDDEDGLADGTDANADGIIDTGAATAPVLDTDADGLPDYTDLESTNPANDGSGPFDITDNPDAAILDAAPLDGVIDDPADQDMDGVLDIVDRAPNLFGAAGDSDNDGVSDTEEIGPDPLNPVDTDNDGTADYLDTDSDNDGFPDALEEVGCPLNANPGDCNSDGIPDRLQADQLETAVTGVGSFGIWSLLMLLPLLFFRLRHNLTSVLSAMAMLLVSATAFTAKPALAHDEFYAGREVIKHEFNRFMRYKQESHGDRDKLIDDNKLFFYPGWYAGGGLGTTNVDPEGSSNGFETGDNSSSGFKIYFGRHFRTHWAWEVSYADLGKAELQNPTRPALFDLVSAESGTPEIDYRVPAGWILYHVMEPNDEFNVYAKAGVSFIDNNANDERIGFEKLTGAQLALGLGAQWRFSDRFFARLELDSYDRDANYAGLSIGMFFGGHEEHTLVMSKKAPVEPASSSAASDLTGQPTVILDDEICNAFATAVDGINFKTNSAELTGSAQDVLKALGISLTAYPDVYIEIQAHTDSDGAAEYNQTLSEKRAQSVMDYLIELGVAAERMSANGYGESQPVADNTTREGKARNRRVEFIPVGANCN